MGPVVRGFVIEPWKKDRNGTPSQLPLVICQILKGSLGGEFYKGTTFRKKGFAILGG